MSSSVEVRKSQYTFFITIWSVCHLSYRIRKNDACTKINYIDDVLRCTHTHTYINTYTRVFERGKKHKINLLREKQKKKTRSIDENCCVLD